MIVEPKAREIGPMPPTRETGCATTSGAAHPQYLYLDALRGWAILMVMLVHVGVQLTASAGGHPLVALRPWVAKICTYSQHGVQLFFVVSAISLTFSALSRDKLDIRAFAVRRFLRIAPMFYLAVVFYLLRDGWAPREWAPYGVDGVDVAATFGFVNLWRDTAVNSVVPGDWSIGAEMNFYLLLPFVLWIARRSFKALVGLVAIAFLVGLGYARLHHVPAGFEDDLPMMFLPQLPVFLFGVVTAFLIVKASPKTVNRGPRRRPAGVHRRCAAADPIGEQPVALWHAVLPVSLCAALYAQEPHRESRPRQGWDGLVQHVPHPFRVADADLEPVSGVDGEPRRADAGARLRAGRRRDVRLRLGDPQVRRDAVHPSRRTPHRPMVRIRRASAPGSRRERARRCPSGLTGTRPRRRRPAVRRSVERRIRLASIERRGDPIRAARRKPGTKPKGVGVRIDRKAKSTHSECGTIILLREPSPGTRDSEAYRALRPRDRGAHFGRPLRRFAMTGRERRKLRRNRFLHSSERVRR